MDFRCSLKKSFEFGYHEGLGWIDAQVVGFDLEGSHLRVPHVGWNDALPARSSLLFDNIPDGSLFYYAHSFYMECEEKKDIAGSCEYGIQFTSAIQKANIYGTQFHPEKSQFYGLQLLKNFLENA